MRSVRTKVTIWVHYQSQARHSSATAKPRPSHIRIGQSTSILRRPLFSMPPPTPASKLSKLSRLMTLCGVWRHCCANPAPGHRMECSMRRTNAVAAVNHWHQPFDPDSVAVAFTNKPATSPRTIIKGDPAPSRVTPTQPPSDLSHLINRCRLSDVPALPQCPPVAYFCVFISNHRDISSSFPLLAGPFCSRRHGFGLKRRPMHRAVTTTRTPYQRDGAVAKRSKRRVNRRLRS
jgi:hypothetical protein